MKKQNSIGSRLLIALVFLFLYAPILLLIIFSFNAGDSSVVWRGFSLDWYGKLFQNRLIMESVYMTLLVSILATAISTIAGTFAAIGLYSLKRRWRSPLMTVSNIPTVNADIVTGVSMCLLFGVFFMGWSSFAGWFNAQELSLLGHILQLPERLTMGFTTLLLAHIAFDIPYVILNVAPKLRQMDKNLIDAAQDLGCTWMQAFWKVILPEIKPGVVSGALIAFTMSVDDFVISYFTAGSSTSTLAMTIYGMTKKRVSPEINAVSTLLFVTVLVLLILSNVLEARQEKLVEMRFEMKPVAQRKPILPPVFRKSWLRRTVAGVCAVSLLLVVAALSHVTGSRPVVNVCSWGEYIDEALITKFEEETGIRVNYQTAESNETLYSLLKSGGGDYDVVVPSDYMISQLIEEDMLTELDYSLIPYGALGEALFRSLAFAADVWVTVPYAWGTLGIIYNENMIEDEITSWSAMFDPKYAGKVMLINNSRDALGIALLYLGYSVNTTDEAQIREAYQLLADATNNGVYAGKIMDEVFQVMEGGNAAMATYYAGDYLSMLENNEDLRFVIPEEGSNWFVDAMCILKDARHPAEAHAWINFIASTDAALANMDYIWYGTANREAIEQYPEYYLENYGEELDQETFDIIQTPPEVLERCEMYLVLPKETRDLYKSLWIKLGV